MLKPCCSFMCVVGAVGLAATWAIAQPPADAKTKAPAPKPAVKAAQPDAHAAPAMSPEMMQRMQVCMEAATPGKQHAVLAKSAGKWNVAMKHWMEPGTTPMESTATSTIEPVLEGRFTRCEYKGDMGDMGMFKGFGFYGYDNVAGEYQCFWIDSMGTGMTTGTGALSADGKTMTWTMHYNCPITKKQATMREVEHFKSDTETLTEFYGPDPVTGKEFKMMELTCTRAGAAPAKAPSPKPAGK